MSATSFVSRMGAVTVTVLLVVGLLAPTAGVAQEAGEPAPPEEEGETLEVVGKMSLPEGAVGEGNRPDLHMWPEGRLGYVVTGTFEPYPASSEDMPRLVAMNLDTLEPEASTDPGETPYIDHMLTFGHHEAIAIDREGGELYVAHNNLYPDDPPLNQAHCGPTRVDAPLLGQTTSSCFAGLYVLDARTLEKRREIEFSPTALDDPSVKLALGSLRYSPPRTPSDEAKLHALLFEATHQGPAVSMSITGLQSWQRTNRQYAVQIDPRTGSVDWMVPVRGCTGGAKYNGVEEGGAFGMAQIFRSPDPSRHVVWVGCWANGIGESAIARLDLDETDSEVLGQQQFLSPVTAITFRSDPTSERMLVKTIKSERALWWIFDGLQGAFITRVGVGPFIEGATRDALDPTSGRLYTFAPPTQGDTATEAGSHDGGMGFTDVRRDQIPQYRWDHSLAGLTGVTEDASDQQQDKLRLAVDPATAERPRRVFLRPSDEDDHFLVIEDPNPVTTDPDRGQRGSRTDDVPERLGRTTATFAGAARGYGLRSILLSGIDAVTGLYDDENPGRGNLEHSFDGQTNTESSCTDRPQTAVFGFAGAPAASQQSIVDQTGTATAVAQPSFVDQPTRQDTETPYSRCRPEGPSQERNLFVDDSRAVLPAWEDLTDGVPIRGGVPVDEPGAGGRIPGVDEQVSCAAPDDSEGDAQDEVNPSFAAHVTCQPGRITGEGLAGLVGVGPVTVADAGSTYEVHRREDGGLVSTVTSWTRGLSIVGEHGAVHVDGILAQATAWANGRSQPEDVSEDPNCDTARTAGSCYRRWFSGARVFDSGGDLIYSCEECADEDNQQQLVDGLQQILGEDFIVSLPHPDDAKAAGSQDGYETAVLKPAGVRFADAVLKGDQLPTVPALEIVRLNDTEKRIGRQTYQFAGVETSLTYGIICFESVVDGRCDIEPASLTIALTDVDGDALQGGLFQVQPDPDGDGEISLDESLEQPRSCTTGPDGTCGFDSIPADTYVVRQAAAPPGYLPAPDKAINLSEGGHGRLDIVNGTPSVTGIAISLHDTSTPPQPLEGAGFELHTGTAPVDAPLATCTTNANGVCEFEVAAVGGIDPITGVVGQDLTHVLQVPAGPYAIHQSSSPDGYQPADDVAFDLPQGQIARVGLTNGVVAAGDGIGGATSPSPGTSDGGSAFGEPVAFQQPPDVPAPQFTINVNVQQEAPAPAPQVAGDEGNTINVFANPVRSAKLLLREPKEAAAFAAAWLLFGAAAAAAWRRRMILAQFDV